MASVLRHSFFSTFMLSTTCFIAVPSCIEYKHCLKSGHRKQLYDKLLIMVSLSNEAYD